MGYSEPMKNFLRNNYGFILGFISGVGFLLFCLEAYKPVKSPFLYIGGLGLSVISSAIYLKLKKDATHSLDLVKENSEA
jgi:hypothetical protein